MLNHEDNELLTRVGPGTMMGNLFRRFWLRPCCPPKSQRLMAIRPLRCSGKIWSLSATPKGRIGILASIARTDGHRCSTAATRIAGCGVFIRAGSSTPTQLRRHAERGRRSPVQAQGSTGIISDQRMGD